MSQLSKEVSTKQLNDLAETPDWTETAVGWVLITTTSEQEHGYDGFSLRVHSYPVEGATHKLPEDKRPAEDIPKEEDTPHLFCETMLSLDYRGNQLPGREPTTYQWQVHTSHEIPDGPQEQLEEPLVTVKRLKAALLDAVNQSG